MEPETAVEEYNRLLVERAELDRGIRAIKPRASAEANAKEFERRAERELKKAEAERERAKPTTTEESATSAQE